jgi:WD40 repeat protein
VGQSTGTILEADAMRGLLALLLVGMAGCGGEETSPGDAATPSSPAISPVESENAAAGAAKTKADELPAQTAAEQKARAKKSAEGRETLTLEEHSNWVLSMSFSPDGKRIISGSIEKTQRVWDAQTGQGQLPHSPCGLPAAR